MNGEEDRCENCGWRIVLVNYALGPRWMHQTAGASFHDGMHEFCHVTVATPRHRKLSPPKVGGYAAGRPVVAAPMPHRFPRRDEGPTLRSMGPRT